MSWFYLDCQRCGKSYFACMCGRDPRPVASPMRSGAPPISPATVSAPPRGCICPPGANKDCEAPMCPRKPFKMGAVG